MGKKLLIDLLKLRDYESIPAEGVYKCDAFAGSFKTIRELATFQFTCRKCENAPCIHACPVEALEKDGNGVIKRAQYKCIRCRSCIVICPFGTMMNDLFEVRTSGRKFISLADEKDRAEFAALFPDDVVRMVEMDENPDENIFSLGSNILIREHIWK